MKHYEAVIIGSGFGGAVNACRLAKTFGDRVLIVERGKRYPMGSFPRKPHDVARNFWNVTEEGRKRPRAFSGQDMTGLFDVRTYRSMDVVQAAGFGGGSLIYANVFLEPPDHVFGSRWPTSCRKANLQEYFEVARQVMGSRPIPQSDDPRRRIIRTEAFQKFAGQVGRKSELVDINVFFGNDFNNPLEIGTQATNRFGALQTSCTYCAECDVGCNYHAKNTLDLNYLFVAEKRYGAEVLTEHLATEIVPLNNLGEADPANDGSNGFQVSCRNLGPSGGSLSITTNRVIVSAGTLGTNEMLLKCRDVSETLPRISRALGTGYSGNGDFLSFVIGNDEPIDPNYGPVITQKIDFNLFEDYETDRAFLMEDASYPAFGAWFAEGAKPGFLHLNSILRAFKSVVRRFCKGRTYGSIGYALRDVLGDDLSYNTAVLLCMGVDRSDGVMRLDHNHCVQVDWPYKNSRPLYDAILAASSKFKDSLGGRKMIPMPSWYWPFRKNVSVHSLGGCPIGTVSEQAVTSADPKSFGQVLGYRNLFVSDGSLIPSAVGANPSLTITAMSEMVAEGITGIKPNADL